MFNIGANIGLILEAAEYVDRRDKREAEHGYASTMPIPDDFSLKKRTKPKKSQGNRSTHNELEKNRRAHLRTCLEMLKDIVPLTQESTRHTTLGLLTKARDYIKGLEEKGKKNNTIRENLRREQRFLRRQLEQLGQGSYRSTQERSSSECSTSPSYTTSNSDSDEVDILGYNSSPSDTDDRSSVGSEISMEDSNHSGSSDGYVGSTNLLFARDAAL